MTPSARARAGAAALAVALLAPGCAGTRTTAGDSTLPGQPMIAQAALRGAATVPDSLAGQFAVYDGEGHPATPEDVAAAMARVDVVFLGELHDDAIGHALQHWLLQRAIHGAGSRPVALGLEMFERDAQLILDEYLAGAIRERDFLVAARPWSDYARFYRPLVETAREAGAAVLATNAPARYVNLVAREGAGGLAATPAARRILPRLPVAPASPALAAKFEALMSEMPAHGSVGPTMAGLLAAQNLRDASMASFIARWLGYNGSGLVVHANGSFHSEGGLGIPEHLARYRPRARTLVVTFRRTDDPAVAPAPSPGDDFVIVTRRAAGE